MAKDSILTMTALENNITTLKLRIDTACQQSHRTNNSVNLLAVSKTRDINTIKNAYDLGLRQFGENYANEAEQKIPDLPDDIEWHFIGPIQSNKTRIIAEHFDWVQSIDRLKIAKRLSEQRPQSKPPLQCLIQINISDDPNKSGIATDELKNLSLQIMQLPNLRLRGLMAIPKAGQTSEQLQRDFARMAELLTELQTLSKHADTLSMGMSADMETAIANGSTMVRIGTDLFGPRD